MLENRLPWCDWIMEANNDIASKGNVGASSLSAIVLAVTIIIAPITRAENLYLARAIGEPAVTTPTPAGSVVELPGLGTEPKPVPADSAREGSSTWKWVVGVALAAAVIALANGGDKGSGGGSSPATGGSSSGNGGGESGRGGGSNGGGDHGSSLPPLPKLPDDD